MIPLWLLVLPALPAEDQPLSWDWPVHTARTWHIETVIGYSNPIWIRAEHNIEGRVERIQSQQLWTCRASEVSRTGWELACVVDDVRLVALALPGEESPVEVVLRELTAALRGATVQLQLDRGGHVRAVDLEGVTKDNRRSSAIHETLRLLVARSAAGFDLHLPPKANQRASWKQKEDLLYAYPISYGSLSGARVVHSLAAHDARHISVSSTGTGTVRVGEPIPETGRLGSDEEPWMLNLASEGQALFDGQQGTLVARRWVVVGRPTASSGWRVGEGVSPYVQTGILTTIEGESRPPSLGASGLWTAEFVPGDAWQQLLANPLWHETTTP